MSATATVEEYHPEAVKMAERFADFMEDEKGDFYHDVRGNMDAARYGFGVVHRKRLIQFLLSECATPLPHKQGAAS